MYRIRGIDNVTRQRAYFVRIGSSKLSRAYAINFFRSVLLIPPMGLMSAVNNRVSGRCPEKLIDSPDEQSYFVRYPRKLRRPGSAVLVLLNEHIIPFIDVGASQDKETTLSTSHPGEKLRKEVCKHHSKSCLMDVAISF